MRVFTGKRTYYVALQPIDREFQAINSLVSLHEVMPEELRDKQTLRSG